MEMLWISNGNHIVPQQRWNTRLNINENAQQYFYMLLAFIQIDKKQVTGQ